ncbi:MAG: hypothetical protein Q9214_002208, partial [Letrouitia sp. 1 TL-2023]
LRLKQSTETIRPKKEKKKVVRKAPSLNAGTGGLQKFKRSHHHHVFSRPPSPEFALARSHTSPATSLGASPVTENAHFGPRFRTGTDGLLRDASSEFQPLHSQHIRRFSSSGLTNARGRIASSKADIFEAKIANAVGEADSSDSEETFVYESNPPEPLSARPHRFHSRTPSATSMASQIDQYGGRTRADGHHSVAGKKSMKFSNSSYHSGAHVEPGDGTNRALNQGGRGSSAHHHHLGRYGRNAGHTSLFDNDSPFSNAVQPLRVQAGNVTKSSLRKSSPRNHHFLRIPGNSKNASEVMDYDLEGEGADDERTPLMGTARSGRNRIHRRQNTGSFRNGYPIEEKGRRECRSVTAYASLATLVTALVAAIVIVLVMCSKSLEFLHIKSIRSVLASEQELMFDLHVGAINPNLVAVQVSDLDVNIFAKSKHVGTGSVSRSSTSQRRSYARKIAKYAPTIGPEVQNYRLDLPLPAHTADGVDEGTDPMPDPETDSQTMLLGRIFEFDSPLVFDPSPIKRQLTSSVGSVRLARPGNSTEEGGSTRWEKVLEHDFELIVRGVVRYSLPLSSRWRSASIGRSVVVHPSVQGDPETGSMAVSEPSHFSGHLRITDFIIVVLSIEQGSRGYPGIGKARQVIESGDIWPARKDRSKLAPNGQVGRDSLGLGKWIAPSATSCFYWTGRPSKPISAQDWEQYCHRDDVDYQSRRLQMLSAHCLPLISWTMSVIIRERERERDRDRDRDWDTRSTYRDRESDRGGYTTVKRYRIPNRDEEDERLTVYKSDRDRDYRSDRGFEETRIIRRERTPEPEPERREIRIERFERDRPPSPPRVERDIRIERYERDREPEPRRFERDYRYEREVDRPHRDPYGVERYSKSVEYFPRPEPPQPIIIRQEPQQIIIQEAPRAPIVVPAPQRDESDYQLIQRSEVQEDRQIARREPERREPEREEDYYYERRVRETSRDNRGDDNFYEERHRRRDVSPGDSVSQVGRRRDRDYSSDDDMVYVRKETRESYGRDESPHHRRHLAEGAIAGLGAAEIIRHHRKHERDGEEGSRHGRIGRDVGAAALGAVGAEAISRARSRHRSKSRRGSRSRSRSYERESRRKHKHRSRSRSKSRVRQLAGLGLAAAATAAAVGYARKQKNQKDDRRSRSRTRRDTVNNEPEDDARDPAHRNKKIAQAGLAGAAVAGLVERARSKSRSGRGKSRSKSRVRQGLPIAAAGLGSAAIAGLYEKSQAGKKEKEARKEARAERRKSKSRSRSRSVPFDGPRSASASDPNLIEYGDQPIYSTGGMPDYRPASQTGYYNNTEDAMVPVSPGAAYSKNRERRRDASSSGSDDGRRRRHRRHKSDSRSRSRTRDLAAAGLGAAAGAAALSEHEKRKQRRKEEKRERRRYEAEHGPGSYDEMRENYPPQQQPYSPLSPDTPGAPGGYAPPPPQETYYPNSNAFPPPPPAGGYTPSPQYNPEYPQQPGQPGQQIDPAYGYPPQQNIYTPPGAAGAYSPPPANPFAPPGNNARRADENVSAEPFLNTSNGVSVDEQRAAEEGLNTASRERRQPGDRRTYQPPRASSQPPSKSVQFDLHTPNSTGTSSPTQIRKRRQRASSSSNDKGYRSDDYDSERSFSDNPSTAPSSFSTHHRHRHSYDHTNGTPRHKHSHRQPPSNANSSTNTLVNSARSPSPTQSDATIDLPDRFNKRGEKIPERGEDPIKDVMDDFLNGSGGGGLGKFVRGFLGSEDDAMGDGGRRRRRRRD